MEKILKISSFYKFVPKPQPHEVQFLRYRVRQTDFFCYFGPFLLFYLPKNLENQNFEKQVYQKS